MGNRGPRCFKCGADYVDAGPAGIETSATFAVAPAAATGAWWCVDRRACDARVAQLALFDDVRFAVDTPRRDPGRPRARRR